MFDNMFLYAAIGFAAAIVISLLIKFLFSKNVESVNMSSHLKSNFQRGKSLQEQVKSMVESGNRNEAVELLKNTFANAEGNELYSKVKNLISENKKIEAIKLIKESGKGSLKEAKELADKIESTGI